MTTDCPGMGRLGVHDVEQPRYGHPFCRACGRVLPVQFEWQALGTPTPESSGGPTVEAVPDPGTAAPLGGVVGGGDLDPACPAQIPSISSSAGQAVSLVAAAEALGIRQPDVLLAAHGPEVAAAAEAYGGWLDKEPRFAGLVQYPGAHTDRLAALEKRVTGLEFDSARLQKIAGVTHERLTRLDDTNGLAEELSAAQGHIRSLLAQLTEIVHRDAKPSNPDTSAAAERAATVEYLRAWGLGDYADRIERGVHRGGR